MKKWQKEAFTPIFYLASIVFLPCGFLSQFNVWNLGY